MARFSDNYPRRTVSDTTVNVMKCGSAVAGDVRCTCGRRYCRCNCLQIVTSVQGSLTATGRAVFHYRRRFKQLYQVYLDVVEKAVHH